MIACYAGQWFSSWVGLTMKGVVARSSVREATSEATAARNLFTY